MLIQRPTRGPPLLFLNLNYHSLHHTCRSRVRYQQRNHGLVVKGYGMGTPVVKKTVEGKVG